MSDNSDPCSVERQRIHRSEELPKSIQSELEARFQYPHQLQCRIGDRQLSLRYRRSRLSELPEAEDGIVCKRDLFCWIYDGADRVGAIHFVEWHVDALVEEQEFLGEMDDHEGLAGELAYVVTSVWDLADIAFEGAILEFRSAWMARGSSIPALWVTAAEMLIGKHYARGFSLLILKAFPLEYEGSATSGGSSPENISPLQGALIRRQAAMTKYYAQKLGTRDLPPRLVPAVSLDCLSSGE